MIVHLKPQNCEGLTVVKMNQPVWDVISQHAHTTDKILQSIETSLIKASTLLVKICNKMANEQKLDSDQRKEFDDFIDESHDVLSMLGHTNKQLNMARRDFLKPELRNEYAHLCTHSLPYSNQLFGDGVSKTAKEIEDTVKIGQKLQSAPFRGAFRSRPAIRGRGRGRGRGFRPPWRLRPSRFKLYWYRFKKQLPSGSPTRLPEVLSTIRKLCRGLIEEYDTIRQEYWKYVSRTLSTSYGEEKSA